MARKRKADKLALARAVPKGGAARSLEDIPNFGRESFAEARLEQYTRAAKWSRLEGGKHASSQ